jgi:hypothetical protein
MIKGITKYWFHDDRIHVLDQDGQEHSQSLLFYPKLMAATDDERSTCEISRIGLHWRDLDEDMSFESFDDPEPTPLQRFFLTHRELKVTEFAKRAGINQNLLFDYINGFKRPSRERELFILEQIHSLGNSYLSVDF